MLFGSELFEEYIGQLAMASMASLDVFTEGEQFDAKKLQEKMRVNSFVYLINWMLGWFISFFLVFSGISVFCFHISLSFPFATGCSEGKRGKACRYT